MSRGCGRTARRPRQPVLGENVTPPPNAQGGMADVVSELKGVYRAIENLAGLMAGHDRFGTQHNTGAGLQPNDGIDVSLPDFLKLKPYIFWVRCDRGSSMILRWDE